MTRLTKAGELPPRTRTLVGKAKAGGKAKAASKSTGKAKKKAGKRK